MRRIASAVVALALLAAIATSAATAAAPVTRTPARTTKLVRIPFPAYDGTLTPYTFKLGYSLTTLVYDTLLWRDAEGVPQPWLARSMQSSQDGRRVTLRLRAGVRWQDGKALTSRDVAFTLRHVASHFHPRFTPELEDVRRVSTPDPLTVVIDLRRPSLGFTDQPLADLPILPEHLWGSLPAGRVAPRGLPVGSGPYRVVRAGPKQGYRFVANRSYFRGVPSVDRLDVPIIRDAQRTYRALQQRTVDMLPVTLPQRVAQQLTGGFGVALSKGPSYSGTALVLNVRRAPFDRPAVRRAVSAALDLERVMINVAPAVKADRGYLHPASPFASTTILHRYDPAAARRAFARLGIAGEVPVLAPDNDAVRLEAGRQVVLALQRAGVRARLVKASAATVGRATGENGSAPTFTAAIVSIPALASYDPDLLGRLFGAGDPRAGLNTSGYRSSALDAIAAEVASAPAQLARRRATKRLLERLERDAPAVPLFFSQGTFAYRPSIYAGWVNIKGLGILDKRSFVRAAVAPADSTPADGGDGGGTSSNDNGASLGDILRTVSLIVLLAAVALGVVAGWRALRSRE